MSNSWEDIGYEDHEWLIELKKRYDRRHFLEMQLKLNNSETDKSIWQEIKNIDSDIMDSIDNYGKDNLPDPWLKEWQECTEDFVLKKFHRTKSWSDLSIGFSKQDENKIRCYHPVWGQEFHAQNDFINIPLIKYDPDEKKNVTSEVYEIIRYFASKDKLEDNNDDYRSAISRANKLLKDFFKLNENPIIGKTNNKTRSKLYTCKIDLKFLD